MRPRHTLVGQNVPTRRLDQRHSPFGSAGASTGDAHPEPRWAAASPAQRPTGPGLVGLPTRGRVRPARRPRRRRVNADGNCWATLNSSESAEDAHNDLLEREAAMQAVDTTEDVFALDIRLTNDVPGGEHNQRCTTNDGCAPTCASSCVTHNPN
jgi:FxLD family lantipeptide